MNTRCTDGANRADIYRRAAKLIEDGKADTSRVGGVRACFAVQQALGGDEEANYREYEKLKDAYVEAVIGTNITFDLYGNDEGPEANNVRILTLCLMAAMVEAGDA